VYMYLWVYECQLHVMPILSQTLSQTLF